MEIGLDVACMATEEGACCLVEVMGRRAGWIAAGTVLAKQGQPANPPHLVLMPEVAFDEEQFLGKVKETVAALNYCVVVVGEGLKNAAGQEVGVDHQRLDAFGHPVLAGAAERLKDLVQNRLNLKARSVMLGYAQRAAAHWASRTDADCAFACGEAAVKAAVAGQSGQMVKLLRRIQPDGSVRWDTGLQALADIANVERLVPRDWITEDGFLPNERFVEYAQPLIEGEVKVPIEAGLPKYVALEKCKVGKKLAPRAYSNEPST
jgi:6-phosphofructokinase 1